MSTKNGRAGEPDNAKNTGGEDQPKPLRFSVSDKFDYYDEACGTLEGIDPLTRYVGGWIALKKVRDNGFTGTLTYQSIAKGTRVSQRTARRAVAQLVSIGFLKPVREAGNTVRYELVPIDWRREDWLDAEESWRDDVTEWLKAEKAHHRRLEQDAASEYLRAEETWLQSELLDAALRSGQRLENVTPWLESTVKAAWRQAETARNSGRTLTAHPLRGLLDEYRADPGAAYLSVMDHAMANGEY